MAFCSSCGHQLADGAKFCFECGTPVAASAALNEQRKTVYEGEIHKCPSCGEILEAFSTNCPTCGYEIRGANNSASLREFTAKLEEIEKSRPTKGFDIKRMLADKVEVSATDLQKISLIRNYAIPNTKEDLIEFLVLAASNISLKSFSDFDSFFESAPKSEQAVSDAWEAKFEQAYEKAKLSFGHTRDFKKIQNIYEKKNGEIKKRKKKSVLPIIGLVASFVLVFALLIGMLSIMEHPDRVKIENENARLEAIVEEVYAHLEQEQYVLARSKASSLVFSGSTTPDGQQASAKWDVTRQQLLDSIDQAEYGSGPVSETPKRRFSITQESAQNQNYLTVKAQLEKQGFTNIATVPVEDLVTDWFTEDGAVDKILVDGSSSINEDVLYPVDVEIIIYYHTFKNTSNNEVTDTVEDTSSANTTIESPSKGTDIVLQNQPIDYSNNVINKGTQYTYGHDEWSLYCATAMSDTLIKIEKWGKTLSTAKTFALEYEVCAIKITDAEYGFSWLDDNQNAFVIQLQDKQDSDFKKPQTITFTISGTDSDTNKGMNYAKDGVCYSYQNDDWHLYRAIPLSEALIKVECWYRSIAFGSFNYGYDVIVIDLLSENTDFEWTDDEHTAFTISMQDTQNSDLKKMTFVAFSLDE